MLLNRLYSFVDKNNADRTIAFLETSLSYCNRMNAQTLRFKAGTTIKNGQAQAVYGTYPVPQAVRHDIAEARRKFVEEYNSYLIPKIESIKADIAETTQKISESPKWLRVLHTVSNLWISLAAFVLILTVWVPVVVWVVQLVCFIIFIVKDKDKRLRELYKTLKLQKKELKSLTHQLKK